MLSHRCSLKCLPRLCIDYICNHIIGNTINVRAQSKYEVILCDLICSFWLIFLVKIFFPCNQTEDIRYFREERCDFVLSPQSHRTMSSLWRESGLNWTDFLPEGEDVQAFISQQVGYKGLHLNPEMAML